MAGEPEQPDINFSCPDCGYDLRSHVTRSRWSKHRLSSTSAICPECGKESDLWELYNALYKNSKWYALIDALLLPISIFTPAILQVSGHYLFAWGFGNLSKFANLILLLSLLWLPCISYFYSRKYWEDKWLGVIITTILGTWIFLRLNFLVVYLMV